MKLHTAPQDEAIMSNVGQIGEFRIRNSAKAFNILSSGLYANKIKAIVRELSCNAVDSHVAAGKADVPFAVHLPNQLEPYFAIRDFGTGLNHAQVTNIYTTYFESTKTDSNDFIGALGLGSKSPFSYTDNFTVTAIQNGHKGIYSAFINAEGVPSIALMMSEPTDEPNGVEVKFSVNDRWDFDKFRQEARAVYQWFDLQPEVTGYAEFTIPDIIYSDKDIIPGVNAVEGRRGSVALMGNIAYPVEVPNADTNLGDLARLLGCGLEMRFAIGELDFQASREGLSYIPETIASIKAKLEAINAVLTARLTEEADAIPNLWERAFFLDHKENNQLWASAVREYVKATDFKLFCADNGGSYYRLGKFTFSEETLAAKFNIVLKGFVKQGHSATYSAIKPQREYDYKAALVDGDRPTWLEFTINVRKDIAFVVNDLKRGALERAKYHWRNAGGTSNGVVYVLEPADKSKAVNAKAFFKALSNPPEDTKFVASGLIERERDSAQRSKNVQILQLERRDNNYRSRRSEDLVWRESAKLDQFDTTKTHYYMPLSGYNAISKVHTNLDLKAVVSYIKDSGLFGDNAISVFGVRKNDLPVVEEMTNWVNLEDYIIATLNSVDDRTITRMAMNALDKYDLLRYNSTVDNAIIDALSPFKLTMQRTRNIEKIRYNKYAVDNLCRLYTPTSTINPSAKYDKFMSDCEAVYVRYPLLNCIREWDLRNRLPALAQYINMIDKAENENI